MLLAEANVARMRHPLDDPRMAGFRDALAGVNAAADRSPGFVWRLQTEAGDATGIRAFDDPLVILNVSVWQSATDLIAYTYAGVHSRAVRRRGEWVLPLDPPVLALWWTAPHLRPTPAESVERLDLLRRVGPTPDAFTFRRAFDADGSPLAPSWRRAPSRELGR
jgi:hypothetical protein